MRPAARLVSTASARRLGFGHGYALTDEMMPRCELIRPLFVTRNTEICSTPTHYVDPAPISILALSCLGYRWDAQLRITARSVPIAKGVALATDFDTPISTG